MIKMVSQHATSYLRAVLLLLTPGAFAYSYPSAIYGTNRYGHTPRRLRAYEPPAFPSYQAPVAAPRYPLSYYKVSPYSDTYTQPDDSYYYPQEAASYPLYYPRSSKYEIYQAVLPYYYTDTPYGTTYDYDPAAELQEEIQEAEREEREEAQPIGHESFYENDNENSQDNYADVNAAFLQNLILSQMYQDSLVKEKGQSFNGYSDYEDSYNQVNEKPSYLEPSSTTAVPSDDEDVKELKQLPKQHKNRQLRKQAKAGNDLHWSQKQGKSHRRKQKEQQPSKRDSNDLDYFQDRYRDAVVYTDRKATVKTADEIVGGSSTPDPLLQELRGQKEEFQMRPATPVRHPFAAPVLTMLSNRDEAKRRAPSVYDTIKHMLDMEKSRDNNKNFDLRPTMKKRIITSEDNLTRQLTVLKKAH